MAEQVPLTTLLSWVWTAHTMEVDNAFEAASAERVGRHFRVSLPMWANGLRFIAEGGTTVDELRARARAACNIGGLERWGWVSVGEGTGGRRDGYGSHRGITGSTVLRPTRAGTYARRLWPRVVEEVEHRWRSRFGAGTIDELRQALRPGVPSMPWSPPEVHASDGFYTHLIEADAADGEGGDGEGGDGEGGDGEGGDGELPLVALAGQVLTGLTLDHENGADVSLPLGANVLRVIGAGTVRTRDLPALTGLSKEGIAMATGYLSRHGLGVSAPGPAVRLTPSGLDALAGYRHRAAQPKDTRLRAALDALVDQRAALSAGLVPPQGCWRGEKPYLAQTQRLLANPTAALPWHPMVLHRGGWPDAS